jgi:transposase
MDKGFKSKVLKLKQTGLSNNKIAKQLGCAISTVSFHCKNAGLGLTKRLPSEEDIKHWTELYEQYRSFQEVAKIVGWNKVTISRYLEKFQRKKLTEVERKKNATLAVGKRRKTIKRNAVAYKGGKCLICGYNRCVEAMDFHHLDPSKKEFGLSINGLSRSLDSIKKELDKCVILCSNCHREFHAGLIKLPMSV